MSDRNLMLTLFFVSLVMLIYVEYMDDYQETVQPDCVETINTNMVDDCVAPSSEE